ncbi:hypothetical protein P9112_011416 [Eukaryota sp. TZLM1-RC]
MLLNKISLSNLSAINSQMTFLTDTLQRELERVAAGQPLSYKQIDTSNPNIMSEIALQQSINLSLAEQYGECTWKLYSDVYESFVLGLKDQSS